MDRTSEFEALTERRNKARAKQYTPLDDITSLRTRINKMKSHLTKYGHDYLDTYGCLPNATIMNEERRDKLDQDIEEFINICNEKKELLLKEAQQADSSTQMIAYREAVIEILAKTLSDFVNCYTQLRTTRMKRNFERQRFDRIEASTGRLSPGQELDSICNETLSLDSLAALVSEDQLSTNSEAQTRTQPKVSAYEDYQQQSLVAAEHHTPISPDEIQTLVLENSQIHDQLMTFDDEVKLISKKVVQISKLQELFTEKVLEQEMDLSNLHEAAIRSSENVREGNELIRDAMMKNASTRVFILFYIITLGFTILFLDWYNP